MNQQHKQRIEEWVKALRSGEYKQTRRSLRRFDAEGSECYCCLGVACEISKVGKWKFNEYCDQKGASKGYLSFQVAEYYELSREEQRILAKMNDDGCDFDTIADFLQQKFLK